MFCYFIIEVSVEINFCIKYFLINYIYIFIINIIMCIFIYLELIEMLYFNLFILLD